MDMITDSNHPPHPAVNLCPHGVDLHEAACGRCGVELSTQDVLQQALTHMLARIQQTEDETKGAHLHARFGDQ